MNGSDRRTHQAGAVDPNDGVVSENHRRRAWIRDLHARGSRMCVSIFVDALDLVQGADRSDYAAAKLDTVTVHF
jgi:hypothetical protein